MFRTVSGDGLFFHRGVSKWVVPSPGERCSLIGDIWPMRSGWLGMICILLSSPGRRYENI